MNPRKVGIVALFAALCLVLSSCGTARRAGKDLGITVASPFVVLYGGGTDAYTTAREARTGSDSGTMTEVLVMVPAFVWHTFKHAIYCVIHAVDFCVFPVYGLAELHPTGPEIVPLDYYTGTIFDEEPKSSSTDPSSGEPKAKPGSASR